MGLATEGAGIRAGCLHGWAVVGHGGERRLLLRGHGERSIASPSTQLVAAGTGSVPWIINDKKPPKKPSLSLSSYQFTLSTLKVRYRAVLRALWHFRPFFVKPWFAALR